MHFSYNVKYLSFNCHGENRRFAYSISRKRETSMIKKSKKDTETRLTSNFFQSLNVT